MGPQDGTLGRQVPRNGMGQNALAWDLVRVPWDGNLVRDLGRDIGTGIWGGIEAGTWDGAEPWGGTSVRYLRAVPQGSTLGLDLGQDGTL